MVRVIDSLLIVGLRTRTLGPVEAVRDNSVSANDLVSFKLPRPVRMLLSATC